MAPVNKVLVQRTWALHELDFRQFNKGPNILTSTNGSTLEEARSRAYGPEFKYDEFMRTPTKLVATILGICLALTVYCMVNIPPVSNMNFTTREC